jgi:hypothetical protein
MGRGKVRGEGLERVALGLTAIAQGNIVSRIGALLRKDSDYALGEQAAVTQLLVHRFVVTAFSCGVPVADMGFDGQGNAARLAMVGNTKVDTAWLMRTKGGLQKEMDACHFFSLFLGLVLFLTLSGNEGSTKSLFKFYTNILLIKTIPLILRPFLVSFCLIYSFPQLQ